MFNQRLIISMLYILLVGCGNQGENKRVEISLKTIQCGMCSNKIADGLNKLEGIQNINFLFLLILFYYFSIGLIKNK